MKRNQCENNSNFWDTLESSLYERFFGDADRISDSYRHYGTYSQYESYEDNENIASYYRGSNECRNPGQSSGQEAGGSSRDNDVLARQLQEMSIYAGSPPRAMIGHSWQESYSSYLEDEEAIARELQQSYDSYLADDAAIARELHQSYDSYLADDAAIARQLQEMEGSLGTMSLHDEPFGSLIDSAWEGNTVHSWEGNRGGTSAIRGGTSAIPGGTSANRGGTSAIRGETSANRGGTSAFPGGTSVIRGGTSIPGTNVRTRAGGEVDLDNMSYEDVRRFEESLGSVSKSLSKEAISRLPAHKYSPSSRRSDSGDAECVICKMEYERGDRLVTLPCTPQYHEDCIKKWLKDKQDLLRLQRRGVCESVNLGF